MRRLTHDRRKDPGRMAVVLDLNVRAATHEIAEAHENRHERGNGIALAEWGHHFDELPRRPIERVHRQARPGIHGREPSHHLGGGTGRAGGHAATTSSSLVPIGKSTIRTTAPRASSAAAKSAAARSTRWFVRTSPSGIEPHGPPLERQRVEVTEQASRPARVPVIHALNPDGGEVRAPPPEAFSLRLHRSTDSRVGVSTSARTRRTK